MSESLAQSLWRAYSGNLYSSSFTRKDDLDLVIPSIYN